MCTIGTRTGNQVRTAGGFNGISKIFYRFIPVVRCIRIQRFLQFIEAAAVGAGCLKQNIFCVIQLAEDNATTSLKQIEKELLAMVEKVSSEVAIIRNTQSDVVDDALKIYQKSRDLGAALTRINTYEDNKKRALETERIRIQQEEEQRRQAEIERAREEERRKLEEIAKAREEERKKAEEALKAAAMETPEPEVPFSLDDAEDGDDLPFPQPQTVTMWYKIIATPDELEQVEMALNSLGIYFERRQA